MACGPHYLRKKIAWMRQVGIIHQGDVAFWSIFKLRKEWNIKCLSMTAKPLTSQQLHFLLKVNITRLQDCSGGVGKKRHNPSDPKCTFSCQTIQVFPNFSSKMLHTNFQGRSGDEIKFREIFEKSTVPIKDLKYWNGSRSQVRSLGRRNHLELTC